jgi:hypothetical protein
LIARRKPQIRLRALAVDPHLAFAQQPINSALGQITPLTHEEVVDALSGIAFDGRYDCDARSNLGFLRSGHQNRPEANSQN